MINLAIFHSDLHIGGQQRALVDLLKALDASQYKITLFVMQSGALNAEIPEHVELVLLKPGRLIHFLPFQLAKRTTILPKGREADSYDIAIDYSSYWNECAVGVSQCRARKKVVWIHSDLAAKYQHEWRYRLSFWLAKAKFKQYDTAVCVSTGAASGYARLVKPEGQSIHAIPNVIDREMLLQKSQEIPAFYVDQSKVNFVFLGRLARVKRINLIIESFLQVRAQRNDVELFIIGDGPERNKLEQLASRSLATEAIHFTGNIKNPYPYVRQMDCLLLMSAYEGQSIVVQEARSLGLNVIASKHLAQYNELIEGDDDVVKAMLSSAKKDAKIQPDMMNTDQYIHLIDDLFHDLIQRTARQDEKD